MNPGQEAGTRSQKGAHQEGDELEGAGLECTACFVGRAGHWVLCTRKDQGALCTGDGALNVQKHECGHRSRGGGLPGGPGRRRCEGQVRQAAVREAGRGGVG